MAKAAMAAAVAQLMGGRLTFGEFLRATRQDWERMGRYLMRRWVAPPGVELADVVQELHVGAYRAIGTYDPTRSANPTAYVVFSAIDKAKKWLHKQRGANLHGNSDSAPGVLPTPISWMASKGGEETGIERAERLWLHADAKAERVAETAQEWDQAVASAPEDVRVALLGLQLYQGEPRETARGLYADTRLRLVCRLGCEADAHRLVRRAVRYAVASVDADA
jgi:DNA-directed RNA polymerase specialized sigma24 family protein